MGGATDSAREKIMKTHAGEFLALREATDSVREKIEMHDWGVGTK